MCLKGKVVIITGGSGGIGQACAEYFAARGSRVLICGRNEKRLYETSERIRGNGGLAFSFVCDVAVEEQCRELVSYCLHEIGPPDILINNAGISMRALFVETDLAVLHTLMDINFWGTVYVTKHSLPHLLKQKGSVIGISSIAGKKGLPGRTGYSASKFALEGFLEALRIENLKTGLHVLTACPGFTSTGIRSAALGADGKPQGDSPRDEAVMMTADQVARSIYQAVLKRRNHLVLTSKGKLTVLLNKFFPSIVDKLVYNHMADEADSPFK